MSKFLHQIDHLGEQNMEMLVEEQNPSPLQLYPPPLRRRPPPPHQDNILHLKSLHHHSGLYQQTEGAAGQTDKVRLGNRPRASQPAYLGHVR